MRRLIGRREVLQGVGLVGLASLLGPLAGNRARAGDRDRLAPPFRYVMVDGQQGRFMAWPANNGLWHWQNGQEILVGYADGPWVDKEGHKIGDPELSRLARSLDGGQTWSREAPVNFVGSDGDPPRITPESIRFGHPDFALRVALAPSSEAADRPGWFYVSDDRGRRWRGPFRFPGLQDERRLEGLKITSRTSYVVTGETAAVIMMSAQDPSLGPLHHRLDKPFVAQTLDGGRSFRFLSWVVPWSDPYRAVMPSTLLIGPGQLLTALRRMNPRDLDQSNWVDLYGSRDGGLSWSLLSRVGETGSRNGNPPALIRLRDGRLACAYANRSRRQILVRLSADGGRSWAEERVIRANPFSHDIGYPQMTQNPHGEIVLIYYLATEARPQSYIEAALFMP